MPAKQIYTRFRAYHLGQAGSSFSYYADGTFTLIEARMTDISKPNVAKELMICNKSAVDCLHITSWDQDHCSVGDLRQIKDCWQSGDLYPNYTRLYRWPEDRLRTGLFGHILWAKILI